MAKHYRNFTDPRFVSIWIGDLNSEADLDDYLQDSFSDDFGVIIETQRIGEIWAEAEPVDIYSLVKDFSRASTFSDKCVEIAKARGIEKAACMFIAYDLKYPESEIVNGNAPLTFLGSIDYPGRAY